MSFPFARWKDNPEITQQYKAFETLLNAYNKYSISDDVQEKIESRKIWQKLGECYWQCVWLLLEAQITQNPDQLFFDEKEDLFINYGLVPTEEYCDTFEIDTSAALPAGLFQYVTLTDYFNELYCFVFQHPYEKPLKGLSLSERKNQLKRRLESNKKRLHLLLQVIMGKENTSIEDNNLTMISNLEKNLPNFTEVEFRTRKYRESNEETHQSMASSHYTYKEAERAMMTLLKERCSLEEGGITEEEYKRILAMHYQAQYCSMALSFLEIEEEKWRQKQERFGEKYKEESVAFQKREFRSMFDAKREYISLTAKSARTDLSPLYIPGKNAKVLPLEQGASLMEEMISRDTDMLRVARVRMYGLPTVILVPGHGYGTYDWSDNTLLIPFVSAHSHEKSVAYALATFRWDSDEDRAIKNSYELIKENRKKSIITLAQSFYKDYFLWLTKECKGYRILPRETHKVFKQLFPILDL